MRNVSADRPRLLAVILLAMGLGGCVAFGRVADNAGVIDHSVGQARNNSILLNIVRASRHEPLYFYSISRVSGAGVEDLKISLPAISFGPHRTASQKNYTIGYNGLSVLDNQQSGSFDVAVLESKNFYEGMLQPLTLDEVGTMLHQGFARELVYRLAVQDITVYGRVPDAQDRLPRDPSLSRFVNDPTSRSDNKFEFFLQGAMDHGVVVESYAVPAASPAGADKSSDAAKDKPAPKVESRLCYDPALVEDDSARDDDRQTRNACGARPPPEPGAPPLPGDLEATWRACTAEANTPLLARVQPPPAAGHNRVCAHLNKQVYAIQLDTRSLFGIYAYLGGVLREHATVKLRGLGASVEPRASGPLLEVDENRGEACFARAALDKTYCIPVTAGDNLKTVFSLLNALQAVKTSPGDLPFTPAIRIEQ